MRPITALPATSTNIVYRVLLRGGAKRKRLRSRLRRVSRAARMKISCSTPMGHTLEQYMRPNSSVMPSHTAMAVVAPANASGNICILAIHPSVVAKLLSMVTNSSVMAVKNARLTMTRVIFRILPVVSLCFLCLVRDDMRITVGCLYRFKGAGIPSLVARQ